MLLIQFDCLELSALLQLLCILVCGYHSTVRLSQLLVSQCLHID
jgi:hypothetical protein